MEQEDLPGAFFTLHYSPFASGLASGPGAEAIATKGQENGWSAGQGSGKTREWVKRTYQPL